MAKNMDMENCIFLMEVPIVAILKTALLKAMADSCTPMEMYMWAIGMMIKPMELDPTSR